MPLHHALSLLVHTQPLQETAQGIALLLQQLRRDPVSKSSYEYFA